jgi:hypothetical protein
MRYSKNKQNQWRAKKIAPITRIDEIDNFDLIEPEEE